MIRQPIAAGKFYPASKKALYDEIESMSKSAGPDKKRALAVVSPHAGYMYSGRIACEVLSGVEITDSMIILGPNHTGAGQSFAVYGKGKWRTPLGAVSIDEDLSAAICKSADILKDDVSAHMHEHSIEVQLPIIQYFKNNFKIVPIVLSEGDFQQYNQIAAALAHSIKNSGKDILIVASSDMTHYEPQDKAKDKDKLAIDAILKLDENLLYEVVKKHDISMCGYIAVMVMISAVKKLGAKSAKLVRYSTSGDIAGDYSSVVGYAGIIIQ
jgi:MEMO1 family protein